MAHLCGWFKGGNCTLGSKFPPMTETKKKRKTAGTVNALTDDSKSIKRRAKPSVIIQPLFPYSTECGGMCQSFQNNRKCAKCLMNARCLTTNMYNDTRQCNIIQPLRVYVQKDGMTLCTTNLTNKTPSTRIQVVADKLVKAIQDKASTNWQEEVVFYTKDFTPQKLLHEHLMQMSWILTRNKISFRCYVDGPEPAFAVNMFETFSSIFMAPSDTYESLFCDTAPKPDLFKFTMDQLEDFDI